MITVSQVNFRDLDRAADLIDERGWCQLFRENAHREICVIGALAFDLPADVDATGHAELTAAIRHVECFLGLDSDAEAVGGDLATWNDSEERIPGDAQDALRDAATALRGADNPNTNGE